MLLPEEASDVSWPTATRMGGGRGMPMLPNRRELALLFANLREQFDRVWYWSSEQHDTRPQLVWGQNFASGIQTVYGRPFRGHARAVQAARAAAELRRRGGCAAADGRTPRVTQWDD